MTTQKAVQERLANAEARMKKAVEALRKELGTIRTGRASPSLVEHLMVDYYGVPTSLNQLAAISVPDARLIVIQTWDKQALPAIEKSILKSDLGLNPANDSTVIRLSLPPLSEERRRELVKLVGRRLEEGRINVRNLRRDTLEELRKLERDKAVSQDEEKRAQELLQKLTDRFIAEIEELGKRKQAELLEV